jgi:4-amino-4-deoxy-L-arabinose transferase-like glycosyltransferase
MVNKKIFYILLFTLLIRLYHITFPVIGWHSWRQADTASIARNFFQEESNIFYPRIDWRGDTEGYVECEFQIYTFLVSGLYNLFGVNEFFGRLVSVIFSVLTVFGIYLLVRRIIDERTALWSAFIYSILPLNIFFGRAFMPEPTMLMCSIYGIYFFVKWIENSSTKDFIISAIFISLAALVKLPALYLGLPLSYLCYKKYGLTFLKNWKIWIFVLIVFVPVAAWYYHAHLLHLQTGLTFSIWNAGKDKWGMIDPLLTFKFYNDIFFKSIAERHLTYPAFVIFIWGLFIKRKHNLEGLFDWWLIGMIIFIFLAPQAHLAQEYYQLPFNIPASVFIAKVFSRYIRFDELKNSFIKNKLEVSVLSLCLLGIFVLSFLRVLNFMKSENINAPIFQLANDVNLNSKNDDKFITITEGNPFMLYMINRKGWASLTDGINEDLILEKKTKGAKFIAGEKIIFKTDTQRNSFEKIKNENEVVKDNQEYFIIKIK